MPSRNMWPVRVNLPSGIATSLVPKPRKPPVLKLIAVTLPSGWASTLSTMPSLLPSEEKTGKPISGFVIGAKTDPGTAGLVPGLGSGSGAGTGWVAAGGDVLGD